MALSQTPEGRKKRNIPIPGQRIGRTVMAVWLCLGIYVLRGRHGAPFYSILAAMQCMQPYASGMWKMAKKRLIGTLIGAFFGSIVVYSSRIAFGDAFESSAFHYLLLGLGVGFGRAAPTPTGIAARSVSGSAGHSMRSSAMPG